MFFGFVHPVKGLRYLLEALARLRPDRPDLHLVIAGGFTSLALPVDEAGAFRRELAARAAELAVSDAVTVTGHLPAEAASVTLAGSDLVVLPFTAGVTTKSGALVTAFAHRLPVVATAADPPDPVLVDGWNAVLVTPTRDADALARGVRRALDDPELRRRIARGGATLAAENTWARIADAHLEVYADVLAAPGGTHLAQPHRRDRLWLQLVESWLPVITTCVRKWWSSRPDSQQHPHTCHDLHRLRAVSLPVRSQLRRAPIHRDPRMR